MWYSISLALGCLILIIGVYKFRQRLTFVKSGSVTTGTVIELKEWTNNEGSLMYKPVFKFKSPSGEEIVFEHNFSTNPSAWKIGEEAQIIFDSKKPQQARLLSYFGVFDYAIVLVAIALPLIFFGAAYFWAQYFFKSLAAR